MQNYNRTKVTTSVMSEKQVKELIEDLRGQKNNQQAKIITGYLKTM